MATIKDVARQAGVSVGTVSKVINKRPVRQPTRNKVERAIRKLNYKPQSRGGSTCHSQSIGLIIPSVVNPFFASLARSVEDAANAHSYSVLLCNTDRDVDKERRYLRLLSEGGVAGIVTFAPLVDSSDMRKVLDRGIPVTAIEHGFDGIDVNLIAIDNAKGIKEAVQHLIELGHRTISLITGPLSRPCNRERLQSFRQTLEAHGRKPIEELIRESTFEYEGGYHLTWEILHRPNPPTAIILGNDLMAIGAMNAAFEKGVSVPGQLSIVGFDDIPQTTHHRPQFTTVHQPVKEAGVEAVQTIIHQQTNPKAVSSMTLATHLVIRETSSQLESVRAAG